jgi:hypothetical protein
MKMLLKLIREPIFLFFFLGILLFLGYKSISGSIERSNRQIYVSQDQVALLEETYTNTWNRPPGVEEREALINDFIMDEIFYKEAVAMGLDKTDLTVKRRLRQIMEMMIDEYATIYPSEDQLRAYLVEHPEKFRRDNRISFRQLHFPVEEREKAMEFLARIQENERAYETYTGGLLLLAEYYENEVSYAVEKAFGAYFATRVFELETGVWNGLLESPFGWHLIYIYDIQEGEVPDLEEIWDQVEREWTVERRNEIKEEGYRVLREKYNIVVEVQ